MADPQSFRIISAHQPVYLPWLGLFHKIAVADKFVIYDDVPYTRYLWYNRNQILGPNGAIQLTVPIQRGRPEGMTHAEVLIDNAQNWRMKHWRSIEQSYRKSPYFKDFATDLQRAYAADWNRLIDVNMHFLKLILGWLDIDTPLLMASDLNLEGAKSARALNLSQRLNAQSLLFGANGRDYADIAAFLAAGVAPIFQDYRHPEYLQKRDTPFQPFMSVIDLLMNHGPASRDILLQGNWSRQQCENYSREMLAENK